MKPLTASVVPPEDLALFEKIEEIVKALPEIDLGRGKNGKKVYVSCQMLVRTLSRFFPVKYKDGYFGDFNSHSWLVTINGLIIDVYPIAVVGGPILIDTRFMTSSQWRHLYQEASFSDANNKTFLANVEKVFKAVRQTINKIS